MNNKIMIYGLTQEDANIKLNDIIDRRIPAIDIKNRTRDFVLLTNGDSYRAVRVHQGARGYKWHYAYIDVFIPKKIVNNIILPAYAGETGCDWGESGVKFEWF